MATNTAYRRTTSAERDADDQRMLRDYRERGDASARDRLVLTYAPLVKYLAGRKARALPAEVEIDDLIGAGLEAMLRALDRFDPDAGATLQTYLWMRIEGALVDELRRQDWVPRRVRTLEREAKNATEKLRREEGRDPTEAELAAALKMTPRALRDHWDEIAVTSVESMTWLSEAEMIPSDDRSIQPETMGMRSAAVERMGRAIAALPKRDREILVMLYEHHMTSEEVRRVLGVSSGRVSQIHKRIRNELAESLQADADLFEEL